MVTALATCGAYLHIGDFWTSPLHSITAVAKVVELVYYYSFDTILC